MKLTLPNKLTRLDAHWEMLAITAVLFVLVAVFVDLKSYSSSYNIRNLERDRR